MAGGAHRLPRVPRGGCAVIVFLGPPLVGQLQRLFEAIPGWLDSLNKLLGDLEGWLATRGIDTTLHINTSDIVRWLRTHGTESLGTLLTLGWSVLGALVNLVLTVIVSFYMLIDGKRIFRFLCRVVPGSRGQGGLRARAPDGVQQVRARTGSARCHRWARMRAGHRDLKLGYRGVWPEGGQYALLFGFWAGVTECIPYGSLAGRGAPVIAAFLPSHRSHRDHHLLRGPATGEPILAPNIVGSSVGVHPLLVIFALLAGAQKRVPGDAGGASAARYGQAYADLLRVQDVQGFLGRR